MTATTHRRSKAAPRAAGLAASLTLHAALLAVATGTYMVVHAAPADDVAGRPLAVAWTPSPTADDVVVARAPTCDRAPPPPRTERSVVVVETPVDVVDVPRPAPVETTAACDESAPEFHRSLSARLPRRGRGGQSSIGDGRLASLGVGGSSSLGVGGSGFGDGPGTGGGVHGVGFGGGDPDGRDDVGASPARGGGATRGPSIVGALPAPAYPRAARSRGWEGLVVLRLSIDADGRVVGVVVDESSGRTALDDAAREAARDWTFAPALADDVPVAGTLRVPVRFVLAD